MKSSQSDDAPKLVKTTFNDLDPKFGSVFFPWVIRHPRYLRAGPRLVRAYKKAKKQRVAAKEVGLVVPPFLIISITSKCNLSCAGCFAEAAGNKEKNGKIELNNTSSLARDQWRAIISEARELGVFSFVLAGGEPFMFPGLIELCQEFKDRIFIILTNGTALSEDDYKRLKRAPNIIVIVSIEGGLELTDSRRGKGIYNRALTCIDRLNKLGVINGISVTITQMNYRYWMDPKNLDQLIKDGIRIGAFLEYIPLSPQLVN
jgi:MoaA/NifB/PqqE/SkfB family radical SAM enzyme